MGSRYQSCLFDVFKAILIFFGGFGPPKTNICRRPVTRPRRFGKVSSVFTLLLPILCLSGVLKTYFLLPPVAVEVAKNITSQTARGALFRATYAQNKPLTAVARETIWYTS
jgi:hypothetical protein